MTAKPKAQSGRPVQRKASSIGSASTAREFNAESGSPVLRIRQPASAQCEVALGNSSVAVGRKQEDNDLAVAADGVTRTRHFTIKWDAGKQRAYVKDCDSRGGTFVFPADHGGERVDLKGSGAYVAPGDVIVFGEAQATVVIPGVDSGPGQGGQPKTKSKSRAAVALVLLAAAIVVAAKLIADRRAPKPPPAPPPDPVADVVEACTKSPFNRDAFGVLRDTLPKGSQAAALAARVESILEKRQAWEKQHDQAKTNQRLQEVLKSPFATGSYANLVLCIEETIEKRKAFEKEQTDQLTDLESFSADLWASWAEQAGRPPLRKRQEFVEAVAEISRPTEGEGAEAAIGRPAVAQAADGVRELLIAWQKEEYGAASTGLINSLKEFGATCLDEQMAQKWKTTVLQFVSEWSSAVRSIEQLEVALPAIILRTEKVVPALEQLPSNGEPPLLEAGAYQSWQTKQSGLNAIRDTLVELAATQADTMTEWELLGKTESQGSEAVRNAVADRRKAFSDTIAKRASGWLAEMRAPSPDMDWGRAEKCAIELAEAPSSELMAVAKPANLGQYRGRFSATETALRAFCTRKYSDHSVGELSAAEEDKLCAILVQAKQLFPQSRWPAQIHGRVRPASRQALP